MLVRNCDQKRILHDCLNFDPRGCQLRSQKADVDQPPAQSVMLLGDCHLTQFEFDIGIEVLEALNDGRQEPIGGRVNEANDQMPVFTLANAPSVCDCPADFLQYSACSFQKDRTSWG